MVIYKNVVSVLCRRRRIGWARNEQLELFSAVLKNLFIPKPQDDGLM